MSESSSESRTRRVIAKASLTTSLVTIFAQATQVSGILGLVDQRCQVFDSLLIGSYRAFAIPATVRQRWVSGHVIRLSCLATTMW